MMMGDRKKLRAVCALAGLALLGAGCYREPVTTEEVSEPLDGRPAREALDLSRPVAQLTLPDPRLVDERAQLLPAPVTMQAGNPSWRVPAGWQAAPLDGVRRGSYRVMGPGGLGAEVPVTAFPGDPGGMLGHVNRWRGQRGLMPVPEQDLQGTVSPFQLGDAEGYVALIAGQENSTVAVAVPHAGSTWFFKFTGPTALVREELPAFLAFAQSVDFPEAR